MSSLFLGPLKLNTGATPVDPRVDLTVGCEFEFILVYHKQKKNDVLNEVQCTNIIRAVLEKPLQVVCNCKSSGPTFDRFTLPMNDHKTKESNKWQVVTDGTVKPTKEEMLALESYNASYGFAGMELKTRVLGKTGCHKMKCCGRDITVHEEIQEVLTRLASTLQTLNSKTIAQQFIYVNSTCGFHVHLRLNEPGRSKLWPLPTLRKLLSLHVACERKIDEFFTTDRINGFKFDEEAGLRRSPFPGHPVHDVDIYNQPLSMFFLADADRKRRRDRERHGVDYVLKGYELDKSAASDCPTETSSEKLSIWLARRLPDVDSWVTRIRWTQDLEDVVNITKGEGANGKKCVFNMNNIKMHSGDQLKKDTVEFRQCRGTLDAAKVISYLDLFVHLTLFCHLKPEDDFYALIDSHGKFHRSEIGIHSLLETVKCNEATKDYFKELSEGTLSISLAEKLKDLQAIAKQQPVAAMAGKALGQEVACTNPAAIKHCIQTKLTYGGYGHFSEKYLRSASLLTISVKNRIVAMDSMLLSFVPALNDKTAPPGVKPGVDASGYGDIMSYDTEPGLEVDRIDLPRRIKGVLMAKESGAYVPLLQDGSPAKTTEKRISTKKPESKQLPGSGTAPVSQAEPPRTLRRSKPQPHRGAHKIRDEESSDSLSAGNDVSIHPSSKSSLRKNDSHGQSLLQTRSSKSSSGSGDGSQRSNPDVRRKGKGPA